jgi:hypothetical protein
MMRSCTILILGIFLFPAICAQAQQPSSALTDEELTNLEAALKQDTNLARMVDYFGQDPVKHADSIP